MLTRWSSFFMSLIWLRSGVVDKVSSWHQRNGCSFLGFIAVVTVVGCLCRSAKKMMMFISTFFSNFIENPYFLGIYVYIYTCHHWNEQFQSALGNRPPKLHRPSGAFDVSLLSERTLPTTPPKTNGWNPKIKVWNMNLPFKEVNSGSSRLFGGSRWWILMILFFFTSFHLESFFRVFE